VPVWQSFYEKNIDKNFEIISAAQDTGGEDAAGSIFQRANVTYTAIIDVNHTISSLYNFVNVPSAVWIDEEGRIVRYNEGTYASSHKLGTFEFGRDERRFGGGEFGGGLVALGAGLDDLDVAHRALLEGALGAREPRLREIQRGLQAGDLRGLFSRLLLERHAAMRRREHDDTSFGSIHKNSEVEFAFQLSSHLDQNASYHLALRTGLPGHETPP